MQLLELKKSKSKMKSPNPNQGKKADSFFEHLGGNFMPTFGPNDLFASQNDTNKWAFLMQYLKKNP